MGTAFEGGGFDTLLPADRAFSEAAGSSRVARTRFTSSSTERHGGPAGERPGVQKAKVRAISVDGPGENVTGVTPWCAQPIQ